MFQIRSQGARNFKGKGSVFGRGRSSRRGNQKQQREDKKLKARIPVETTSDENQCSVADSEVSNAAKPTHKEARFQDAEDDAQNEGGEAELPNETGYRPEGL